MSTNTMQRVVIHSFYHNLSQFLNFKRESLINESVSSNYQFFAFVDNTKERNLCLLELTSSERIHPEEKDLFLRNSLGIKDVERFTWERVVHSSFSRIAIVQKSGQVTVLEIRKNSSGGKRFMKHTIWTITPTTMRKISERFPNVSMKDVALDTLAFSDNTLSLLLNKRIVISCFIDLSDIVESSACFLLDKNAKHAEVSNGHLFVVDVSNHLCGYWLPSGALFMCMDLMACITEKEEALLVDYFSISLSSNYALVGIGGEFYKISIQIPRESDFSPFLQQPDTVVSSALHYPVMRKNMRPSFRSPVSAFVKQIPSTVKENGTSCKSYSSTEASSKMTLPDHVLGQRCFQLVCLPQHCFFLFVNDSGDHYQVVTFNMEKRAVCFEESFSQPAILINTSGREWSPPLLISPSELSVFLFNNNSEKLVNELMSYAGGSVAEIIAMLNQWKHITLDSALIEQGLKNRQLDTVRFFLKMKNDDCTLLWSMETLKSLTTKEQFTTWKSKVLGHLDEWKKLFSMLALAIQSNITNSASRHFAEQLAQVVLQTITHTLNCIHTGLKNCKDSMSHSHLSAVAMDVNSNLMSHIKQLRALLGNENVAGSTSVSQQVEVKPDVSENIARQFKTWNGMSLEDAIRNAITMRKIPLLQVWLSSEKKLSGQEKSVNLLYNIQESGMMLVRECLEVRNLNQAKTLLSSMGFQAEKKLMELFRRTSDRDLRVVLALELDKSKVLSSKDKQVLEKMHMIEQLYPCSSFLKSQELIQTTSTASESVISRWTGNIHLPNMRTTQDDANLSSEYTPSSRYFRFLFEWMEFVDDTCCERILIPGLWNENASWVRDHVNARTVWKYLLDYGSHDNLKVWIKKWYSSFMEMSNSEFPYDWPIESSMVEMVKNAPRHTAEFVLDTMIGYGVISEEEFRDVKLLFQRLGRVSNILSNPQQLRLPGSPETDFDVQNQVLEHLLQNNLVNVLAMFVQDNRSVVKANNPFLRMVVSFYEWSKQPDDIMLEFDCILCTAEYLYSLPRRSIQSVMEHGHTLLALFTLPLLPVNLCEVVCIEGEKWSVDKQTILSAVENYPLLKIAFFPDETHSAQDISVYQLLQGAAPFDSAKLFGWQETNTVKYEDTLSAMPSFSLPYLVDQYGLNAEITFVYYLMQGRPCFAFLKCLAKLLLKCKGSKHQKLESVIREVYVVALKNLHSSRITASCVMFLEMMGEDSLPLRVHLKIAHTIHTFNPQGFIHGQSILENLLILALQKTDDGLAAANAVLDLLMVAYENKFGVMNKCSYEECIAWRLIVKFCYIYGLLFPLHFLEKCAKANDWLMFFLHAQMYNYPRQQVLLASKKFSNQFIAEHVKKVLESRLVTLFEEIVHVKQEGRRSKLKGSALQSKDLRFSLYAKIGLKKSSGRASPEIREKHPPVEEDLVSLCSEDLQSLEYMPSLESESGEPGFVLNEESCDIFDLLRQCETEDSWKALLISAITLNNPLPALLAASFSNSQAIDCLGTFVFTLLTQQSKKAVLVDIGVQSPPSSWSRMDFEILLKTAVKHRQVKLLKMAFQLFVTHSLLRELLDYLVAFLHEKNYDASAEKLKDFEDHVDKHIQGKIILPFDEKSIFTDQEWVQKIIILLLTSALLACNSTYEKLVLLRHYTFGDVQRNFASTVCPDYRKLYQLVQSVQSVEVAMPIDKLLLPQDHPGYITAVQNIIEELQNMKLYSEARSFATEAQFPLDQVIINELNLEASFQKKSPTWDLTVTKLKFWMNCNDVMKKSHVQPLAAVDFFKTYKEWVTSSEEKCVILMYILHWMEAVSSTRMEKRLSVVEFEKEMWMALINVELSIQSKKDSSDDVEANNHFWEIMLSSFEKDSHGFIDALALETEAYFDDDDYSVPIEDHQEKQVLEAIIHRLLSRGLVWHAQKIATFYCFDSVELQIIMVALKVAVGKMTYQDIPPFIIARLPHEGDTYQHKLSFLTIARLPTDSTGAYGGALQPIVQSHYSSDQESVLSVLVKLQAVDFYSSPLCNRILLHYRASCLLKESFENVIKENVFTVAKRLLKVQSPDKYRLARELFAVHSVSDDKIASFLCSEVLSNPHDYHFSVPDIEIGNDAEGPWTLYTPSNVSWHFKQVSKLCSDPSLLGNKILSMTSSDLEGKTKHELALEVELCIRSHDCFYAACNMEGISRILKKARVLTQALAHLKEYSLMVRLVTGIGHFSEMAYIFDILAENHQFEMLLGKGTEKVPQLRIALLEYLKSKNFQDSDMYSLVALSFRLFREIAETLDSTAQRRLSYMYIKTPGLKDELEIALQEMVDAAERYTNADCLHHALKCAQKAELIALQLSLLSSGIWILNLEEKAVKNFISKHPNFLEALIVAEAYDEHQSWSDALYCNVVKRGNWSYLEDFLAYLNLTPAIVEEIAQRYMQSAQKEKSDQEQGNMQTLLGHVESLETRYSLARKLNFISYAKLLLENENSCYLYDILSQST